ncbi:uncharacterized protein LOC142588008 isoform X5 [Dermacentor variabilis]|uniref:uncharacterized protein LOC142588008 isoform X5 n=1 Tax=Dermacentor variabilis TaxID=34621 RepID=UPI003F5B87D7
MPPRKYQTEEERKRAKALQRRQRYATRTEAARAAREERKRIRAAREREVREIQRAAEELRLARLLEKEEKRRAAEQQRRAKRAAAEQTAETKRHGSEDRHSKGGHLVISNIYSVAEQSPVVAAAESEAPIVPELRARAIFHPAWRERHLTHTQEQATCSKRHFQCQACALVLCRRYFLRVHHIFLGRYENTRGVREATRWPSEQSVSDGPEKKKIKQEPHYDEDVSWDTNDSVDDRVDGESLSSNQAQAQQHRAEATLENTADTSMASTSASPTAGSQQDAFHFFGMMVADRLRRLPRGAALRALNAMHQVLFEHEEEAGF